MKTNITYICRESKATTTQPTTLRILHQEGNGLYFVELRGGENYDGPISHQKLFSRFEIIDQLNGENDSGKPSSLADTSLGIRYYFRAIGGEAEGEITPIAFSQNKKAVFCHQKFFGSSSYYSGSSWLLVSTFDARYQIENTFTSHEV